MLLEHVHNSYIQRKTSKLSPSTIRYYEGYWRNWLKGSFETKEISSITREQVEDSIQDAPPTQRNRIKTYVSCLFKHAEVYHEVEGLRNPTQGIERDKENPRKRFVRQNEWEQISQGLSILDKGNRDEASFALFVRLVILTGVRKSEAENSLIQNIDSERGCLTVDGKTGEREVPLSPLLLSLLTSHIGNKTEGYIFPAKKSSNKGMNFSYKWDKFRKDIGLPDLTRHDLRRTFGVTGLNNGLSLEEVQGLLGHTSLLTTEKSYAWLLTSTKKKAADKLSATLQQNII